MSFWTRLLQSLPLNLSPSKTAPLSAGSLAEATISISLLWGLHTWGPKAVEKEKTFKELHQPGNPVGNFVGNFASSRDDDARLPENGEPR
ncbi:hypothetical protein IMSHALPRED_009870 [Imshaugia aleurites]|uniref:Uncharacterized protein n=1 Tax=Imshaugia aleurites TaxID=172621 RepID=A0A8H3G865_9LECA|nr:hypothetical protein IMSHALPRED_009870 [Imshaugia aleurites]